MASCNCTGKCREYGGCAVNPLAPTVGTTYIWPTKPLTEDDIRRIIREELKR